MARLYDRGLSDKNKIPVRVPFRAPLKGLHKVTLRVCLGALVIKLE